MKANPSDDDRALIADVIAAYIRKNPGQRYTDHAESLCTEKAGIDEWDRDHVQQKFVDLPRLLDALIAELLKGRRHWDDNFTPKPLDTRAAHRKPHHCAECGIEILPRPRGRILYRIGARTVCSRCVHHLRLAVNGKSITESLCLECARPFRAVHPRRGRAPVYCSLRCSNTARKRSTRARATS